VRRHYDLQGYCEKGPDRIGREVILPEGTRVSVIPEEPCAIDSQTSAITLKQWLQEVRQVRVQFPRTSDSAEILQRLRQQRANR
jgi:hypothetical protein